MCIKYILINCQLKDELRKFKKEFLDGLKKFFGLVPNSLEFNFNKQIKMNCKRCCRFDQIELELTYGFTNSACFH